jgi:hypothetical protein
VTDWARLRALIDDGDVPGIVRATKGLTEQQRRELSQPVSEHAKSLRRAFTNPLWSGDTMRLQQRRAAVTVACAACLTSAARLAGEITWTSLFRFDEKLPDPAAAVLEALRARDVPWLPDLARRLAERLPVGGGERLWRSKDVMRLTEGLVAMTGIDPPLADGYVHGWVRQDWYRPEGGLADAVRRDRRLVALVARMFEVDGLGIPAAPLAALAAEGVLDRAMLIDGCLSRLQRGGQAFDLQCVLDLLEALAPSLDEVVLRSADYVGLLPGAHRMAAEMAQRELRRLDDSGRLEPEVLADVSEIVLHRREHKLVRAQLEWLDEVARREPGRSGEVLRAVVAAFGQESAELQRRALTVARRLAGPADEKARFYAAQAAVVLGPALRARAAAAFGIPVGPAPGAEPALPGPLATAPAWVPPELPPPIASPDELDAELTIMGAETTGSDPVRLERVLAALVAFSWQDRTGLRDGLRTCLGAFASSSGLDDPATVRDSRALWSATELWERMPEGLWEWMPETAVLGAIIGSALTGGLRPADPRSPQPLPAGPAARYPPGGPRSRLPDLRPPDVRPPAPQRVMILRLREIWAGLRSEPRPLLMATPTSASGLLDAEVLLARLERAAAEGWEPWELDLEQALLRLPRECCSAVASQPIVQQARRLGTPAAARLADWLEDGGLPDPEVIAVTAAATVTETGRRGKAYVHARLPRTLAEVWPSASGPARPTGTLAADHPAAGPGTMAALLTELTEPQRWLGDDETSQIWKRQSAQTAWLACWPGLLPGHRDIIAAHLVPLFARESFFDRDYDDGAGVDSLLPLLAEADGPVGPGLRLALGYGLAAREQPGQMAAVRALVILAGRGQLDGAALGHKIGDLAALGEVSLAGLASALRDASFSGGMTAPLWELIVAALPGVLTEAPGRPPRGLADLIGLGADLAEVVRPAGPVPAGLADVAARAGSARYVGESRRLLAALSGH